MNKKIIIFVMGSLINFSILILLVIFGVICPNFIFTNSYSVFGIDVSNHQGDIDWVKVAQNKKTRFAFIKATEGKDYQDKYFITNWHAASKAGLIKGAYHYFKITSSGEEQAENFIKNVPYEKGCLPPVVDIEENGLSKVAFRKELGDYLTSVEKTYHQKPILYVVYPLYDEYIKGEFEQYPIWIRDVFLPPKLSDNREWMFWQYSERGRVDGIRTDVDLNLFRKDMNELNSLLSK